jgi:hypothetical protein
MSEGEGVGTEEKKEEEPLWRQVADATQMTHDAPDAANGVIQKWGLTQSASQANDWQEAGADAARRAAQAKQLAKNATAMNNDEMAARFGERAESLTDMQENLEGAAKYERGPLNAFMENGLVKGGFGVTGMALGGLQAYDGWNEWKEGNKTQGALDMAAGGAGVGAGGLATASALGLIGETGALATAGTIAAPVAAAVGLAAAGNKWTSQHDLLGMFRDNHGGGTWGYGDDGKPRDSLHWVGDMTSGAYHGVDNAIENKLGDHWYSKALGKVGGGIAGAGAALGTGVTALGADLIGGVGAVGEGLYHGAGWLGGKIGQGAGWAADKVGQGASWLGGEIGSGAKAIGSGISSAASTVGHGISSAASTVGHGLSSAGHFITSHLW